MTAMPTTDNDLAQRTRTVAFSSRIQMWAVLHQIASMRGLHLLWDQPLTLAGEHLVTIHITFNHALLQELVETLLQEQIASIEIDAIIDAMIEEAAWHVHPALELLLHLPGQADT